MENKAHNQNPIKPTSKFPKFSFSWIYGTIILLLIGSYFIKENTPPQKITLSTFKEYVNKGMIKKIDVYSSKNEVEAQLIDYT